MTYLIIGIAVAVVCSVSGDFFVKEGSDRMRTSSVEGLDGWKKRINPIEQIKYVRRANIFNWRLNLGIFFLAFYFAGYLMAIKSAPVTLVVPLMSITHILNTINGKYVLHEEVTLLRWAGVAVIICGIVILGLSGGSGAGGG